MLLIILSVCVVHDISQRDIGGIIKIDCHFLSGTCKLKEEEMVKDSHDKVKSIILTRNERFKRFLKFIELLKIILNIAFNNKKKNTRRVIKYTNLESFKVIMSEKRIDLIPFQRFKIVAVNKFRQDTVIFKEPRLSKKLLFF